VNEQKQQYNLSLLSYYKSLTSLLWKAIPRNDNYYNLFWLFGLCFCFLMKVWNIDMDTWQGHTLGMSLYLLIVMLNMCTHNQRSTWMFVC